MTDVRKTRKWQPLLQAAGGASVLVVGLATSCTTTTSGNLLPPAVQDVPDFGDAAVDAPAADTSSDIPLPPDATATDAE